MRLLNLLTPSAGADECTARDFVTVGEYSHAAATILFVVNPSGFTSHRRLTSMLASQKTRGVLRGYVAYGDGDDAQHNPVFHEQMGKDAGVTTLSLLSPRNGMADRLTGMLLMMTSLDSAPESASYFARAGAMPRLWDLLRHLRTDPRAAQHAGDVLRLLSVLEAACRRASAEDAGVHDAASSIDLADSHRSVIDSFA